MMKRGKGECMTRNKRRLSLTEPNQQQAATSTTTDKKRKVSNKAEKKPCSKSVRPAKIPKNKAILKNQLPDKFCIKCEKVFDNCFDLVAHKCFVCSVCHKNFDSDVLLKNHELTHNKANEEPSNDYCKFCSSKFDVSSSLAKHEALCKNKNFKHCSMCNKKLHPRSKHEFCKRCISLIGKTGKDYSLRRNSKDENPLGMPVLAESAGNASLGINFHSVANFIQPQAVNKRQDKNSSTKGKISKLALDGKTPEKCLSTTEIQEACTAKYKLTDPEDIFKSDSHINIRKTFDKSKKVLPDKSVESKESPIEPSHEEMPSQFKKPNNITLVNRNKSDRLTSNNSHVSSGGEKIIKRQLKKNSGNLLLEGAVTKSNLLSGKKQESPKTEKVSSLTEKEKFISEHSNSNIQNKVKEGEIKIESLIDSLPDSNSGILLKCFLNESDYKCVKCCKQFGSVELASMHYASCKIKFIKLRKQFVSLSNVLWVCTLCSSHFELIADLLKHKTSCSVSSVQKTSDSVILNQKYSEKFLNKCKKCGFTCLSPMIFEKHPCEESMKSMQKCCVKLDNSRKLELKAKNVTYYCCEFCKKDFLDPKAYDTHMRDNHCNVYDGTLKPLSLQIRKVALAVKQESNCDNSFNASTPVISQAAPLESIFSLNNLNSNMDDPENVNEHEQVSSEDLFRYRIPRVLESAPLDGEFIRKIVGCNCAPNNSGLGREDVKPCITCLQNYTANYMSEKFGNEFIEQNPQNSDEFQTQLVLNSYPNRVCHSTTGDHRPFPTPPRTPDSISSQGQSSESQSSKHTGRLSNSEDPQNNNSAQVETLSMKLSWNYSTGETDVFAMVVSEEDLAVLNYICAACYAALNENDVCSHMQMHHNKSSGDVNVSYVKQAQECS